MRVFVVPALALGLGIAAGISCVGVNYPQVAFRCNPRQAPDACPEDFFCCSDDPAAIGGALPDYTGRGVSGGAEPLFSGNNNGLGTSGMCVKTADLAGGGGLMEPAALNCPIPCNPTWSDADIANVCGGAAFACCQTVELEPSDCIEGEDGVWRPARGTDISEDGPTQWAPTQHVTHQDPGGRGCREYAGGDRGKFEDCVAQLSVADQRGFCLRNAECPLTDPSYVDPCEALNGAQPGATGGGGGGGDTDDDTGA